MFELKVKLYMPTPFGTQIVFGETNDPYFSGYVTSSTKKIKLTRDLNPECKNGLYDFVVAEGNLTDDDIDTVFQAM